MEGNHLDIMKAMCEKASADAVRGEGQAVSHVIRNKTHVHEMLSSLLFNVVLEVPGQRN